MTHQVMLSVIEIFISLVIESIILSGVFSYLANKANEKQEQQLKEEMHRIEEQNKLIFEQLQQQSKDTEARLLHAIDLTCAKCIEIETKMERAWN